MFLIKLKQCPISKREFPHSIWRNGPDPFHKFLCIVWKMVYSINAVFAYSSVFWVTNLSSFKSIKEYFQKKYYKNWKGDGCNDLSDIYYSSVSSCHQHALQ